MSNIPNSGSYIQIEGAEYRAPVSESLIQSMGGAINFIKDELVTELAYLHNKLQPVGTIYPSLLSEAQFQAQQGNANWVLCDGRSVSGSTYNTVTGNSSLPDLRGNYLRCRDYGRGRDTHGDNAVGVEYGDVTGPHTHTIDAGQFTHAHSVTAYETFVTGTSGLLYGTGTIPHSVATSNTSQGMTTDANAGAESNPRTVVVNFFIRIN